MDAMDARLRTGFRSMSDAWREGMDVVELGALGLHPLWISHSSPWGPGVGQSCAAFLRFGGFRRRVVGGPWGLPGLLCPPSPLKRAVFRSLLPLITAPRDDQSPLENAPDETTRIKATPALIFPLGSPTGFKRLADRCTDLRREHVMAVTRMIEPRTDSCQCSMRASHLRESHPDTTTYAPDHSPP